MKKIFLSVLLLAGCVLLQAQSQFSGWLASFNTIKTGKKTSIHADLQLRSSDELGYIQTLLLRTGVNIHLNKKLIVTTGYAYIRNYRSIAAIAGYAAEHRVWEQFLYNHKIKRIQVSHRFRIEQRFVPKVKVENNDLETYGYGYSNRFRYFTRMLLPLNNYPSFTKGMFAALQNEVFLNFGNTAQVNGKAFDQNRLYFAAGYRINSSFDLEAGYMYQYISARSATINNNVVQIAGYLRL